MIRLFNTLTRKKEDFVPLEPGKVSMYCCGPTVYDFAHIGNLRAYVFDDLLKRMFLYNGFSVTQVINITDVGHLTSDADEGEDKLMKAIKRENLPVSTESMLLIAKKYTEAFKRDCELLNILSPEYMPKASEHIAEMIDIIRKIEQNGATYDTSTAVMFDISKYPAYAELGKLDLEGQKEGFRKDVVEDPEKRNPQDFVLWLHGRPNHVMQWDSPWGRGFPGWHIECTAMATKYLGERFDIHTGGIDHIPVHHSNERAQAEVAFGHKWVNYWLHNEHLTINKQKMAKSAGTFFILKDLLDRGFNPLDFRYLCLSSHYRSHLNFSWDALETARNSFQSLKEKVLLLRQDPSSNPADNSYADDFLAAIDDDLNTPQALAVLWSVIKDGSLGSKEKLELLLGFDSVLGLRLGDVREESAPAEIAALIREREEARAGKDWARSDELRDLLKEKGYIVEDTPDGTKWKKVL